MADINILDLGKELGFEVDANDPIGSMKRAADMLREKAAKADETQAVDKRLASLEDALKGLANADNAGGEPPKPGDKGTDPETGRRAQEVLAKAKITPAQHELSAIMDRLPRDDEEKALHDFNDLAFLMSRVKGVPVQSLPFFQKTIERSPALQKTMTSDGSAGYGVDWVPTGFSAQIWEDIRLKTLVGSNLVGVNMPTLAYKMPYKAGSATAYLTAQATDISPSDFTTGADTLTAVGFGCAIKFSGEMDEDSVAPIMPVVRMDIADTLAEGLENALLNGDNASTNQDGVTGTTDVRKAWDGFRFLSLANSETYADLGTFSTDNLRALRAKMGKYGINPNDLMWVTGPAGWHKFLNLDEVTTMDKYGAAATILSGEIGKFDGIPIVVSGQIKENLNASGVYDTSTTDNTVVHLINKRLFYLGYRRGVTIEDDRFILGDYQLVVGKARWAFEPRITVSATYPTAVIGYNVAV